MNQPNSIRCAHCNLLNFASETFCKRCKNSLQEHNLTGGQNEVNINIDTTSSVPPRFDVTRDNSFPNNSQPHHNQSFQPQSDQSNRQSDNESSEYQLQNQAGFQQWRQEQVRENSPFNNQSFPMPIYPPNYYPANAPSVWRRGSELILHRYGGTLPACCVKCGQQISGHSDGSYVRQKYRWHHPLVYIALISPLIYLILASVLSRRVSVDLPLCNKHLENRSSTGKLLAGGGIAAMIAIFFFGSFGYVGFAFLIFLASLTGIVLGYEYSYKPLQISKIEDNYIYLKNADREFLSRLPNC